MSKFIIQNNQPAIDCGHGYGYGIPLNNVKEWTTVVEPAAPLRLKVEIRRKSSDGSEQLNVSYQAYQDRVKVTLTDMYGNPIELIARIEHTKQAEEGIETIKFEAVIASDDCGISPAPCAPSQPEIAPPAFPQPAWPAWPTAPQYPQIVPYVPSAPTFPTFPNWTPEYPQVTPIWIWPQVYPNSTPMPCWVCAAQPAATDTSGTTDKTETVCQTSSNFEPQGPRGKLF